MTLKTFLEKRDCDVDESRSQESLIIWENQFRNPRSYSLSLWTVGCVVGLLASLFIRTEIIIERSAWLKKLFSCRMIFFHSSNNNWSQVKWISSSALLLFCLLLERAEISMKTHSTHTHSPRSRVIRTLKDKHSRNLFES